MALEAPHFAKSATVRAYVSRSQVDPSTSMLAEAPPAKLHGTFFPIPKLK